MKLAVLQLGADAFTATAVIGAQAMVLNLAQAIELMCEMTSNDFYKSMPPRTSSQVWQDVYHPVVPNGKTAYVKVTLRDEGSIVIQL